jgi:hypothetical protein
MNATIKPEAAEQLSQSLYRDYRNLRKAVTDEEVDNRTIVLLNRLGRTIEEAKRTLTVLAKENDKNK